jgi:hypothetical protein
MSDTTPVLPDENPIEALIPAKTRPYIYAVFGLVGIILGAISVGLLAHGKLPEWAAIATVVYNFLAPFFSALATAHVNKVTT